MFYTFSGLGLECVLDGPLSSLSLRTTKLNADSRYDISSIAIIVFAIKVSEIRCACRFELHCFVFQMWDSRELEF